MSVHSKGFAPVLLMIVIAALVVGGWYMVSFSRRDGVVADDMYAIGDVKWVFNQLSEQGPSGEAPRVEVKLQLIDFAKNGKSYEVAPFNVGEYDGSCSVMDVSGDFPGALSTVQCWWAGGGDQLAVFREGNILKIRTRGVDEEQTAPAVPTDLLTIDLATIVKEPAGQ